MLNQTVIVGRLVDNPQKVDDKSIIIKIAVPRSYKNSEGEYDTDFITCKLWNTIAESTTEYCKKRDLLGIKGRLQSDEDDRLTLIAEKVTFLSSKKEDGED